MSERLPFVSKQAISKARQRISHKAFEVLFRDCIEVYHRNFKDFRLWNGFHIYAVDGSTIQIPESQENIEVFGGNPNKTDKLTPLASVSTLYDIMNDMILEITFNPYRYNERTAAKEHMEFMPNHPTTIVLFDRGYPSEELFRYLDSKRMFFLMRIPKTFKKLIFSAECCTFYISSKPFEIRTDIKVHSFYFRRWNKRAFGNKCTAGAA